MAQGPQPAPRIEITANEQNTLMLTAGQAYVINAPRHECFWRLKNMGPADVWARWDELGDAAIDDPASFVLDAGEIIPNFRTNRLSLVCSSQPGGGARISFVVA